MKDFDPIAFASTCLIILALLGFAFIAILVKENIDIVQVQLFAVLGLIFLGHKLYDHFKSF
jgi:hypothetical protein